MKKYNSTIEGTWAKVLSYKVTEEEKTTLKDSKDIAVVQALMADIKSKKEAAVEAPKLDELVAYYNDLKLALELKPEDVYSLISVNMAEVGAGEYRGIVNYRVGKEHKQYRFPKNEITTFKF
jgi:uncharacterized protein YehS (DUF1456 family)